MKKTTLVLAAAMIFTVFSCSNESTVNPRPESEILQNVFISGFVDGYFDLDDTDETEAVPDGTQVFATINTSYQVSNDADVDYVDKTYVTTVGSDGTYSFEIPVGPDGAEIYIRFPQIRTTITSGSEDEDNVIIDGGGSWVEILPGESQFVDFTYND